MKRLRAEMAEIREQQKRIEEGEMEIRESFQEIEFEQDQLRKETLLISKQAARYQRSLNEMFKIVIARENSNLSEADGLIQCLRLVSPDSLSLSFFLYASLNLIRHHPLKSSCLIYIYGFLFQSLIYYFLYMNSYVL